MKYLLPALAALYSYAACASVEPKMVKPKTVTILPREKFDPLKCTTHQERISGKICEWNECRNSDYVWTDDLMRCTDDVTTDTGASPFVSMPTATIRDGMLSLPAPADLD